MAISGVTRLYVAAGNALAVLTRTAGSGDWQAMLRLQGLSVQCVALDPRRPERVYGGTFGQGMWVSSDAGETWAPAGEGISHSEVMAVAVSALERGGGPDDLGVVWVGTEPSASFRSEDGGRTWQERPSLRAVPSAPTWSFPPRPWTSHVRWIAPDPHVAERVFVGIEAGGVLRSLDAGVTWEDSKPAAQRDAHTLATHPRAPERVYEASGGGYAQSDDGGASWRRDDEGLRWRYLWGMAADPADPDTVVVSASRSAHQAHRDPEATLYRRTRETAWEEVRAGLPPAAGTYAYVLATHPAEPGVFYAAPHRGAFYRSADAGRTWEQLAISGWNGYQPDDVRGLAVAAY